MGEWERHAEGCTQTAPALAQRLTVDAQRLFFVSIRIAFVLTLVVVVLGAYVRLSDAGLGCPDWPGCYGRLLAPTQAAVVEEASLAFPERPVEVAKAWKEMVHRYAAALLGLVILGLAVLAWRKRHRPGQPVAIPILLLALVVFQSLLGHVDRDSATEAGRGDGSPARRIRHSASCVAPGSGDAICQPPTGSETDSSGRHIAHRTAPASHGAGSCRMSPVWLSWS
jgi:hypothetical protein